MRKNAEKASVLELRPENILEVHSKGHVLLRESCGRGRDVCVSDGNILVGR